LDFIFVLQTGFGSGFLPLGSVLESDKKNLSPNAPGYRYSAELIFTLDTQLRNSADLNKVL